MSSQQQQTTSTVRALWWGYAHYVAYSLGSFTLLLINLVCSPDYLWVTWPVLLGSIVLFVHIALILTWADWGEQGPRKVSPEEALQRVHRNGQIT